MKEGNDTVYLKEKKSFIYNVKQGICSVGRWKIMKKTIKNKLNFIKDYKVEILFLKDL